MHVNVYCLADDVLKVEIGRKGQKNSAKFSKKWGKMPKKLGAMDEQRYNDISAIAISVITALQCNLFNVITSGHEQSK